MSIHYYAPGDRVLACGVTPWDHEHTRRGSEVTCTECLSSVPGEEKPKSMTTVQFKLLEPDSMKPTKAHPTDAGWDLYAYPKTSWGARDTHLEIEPKMTANVYTGVAVCTPRGWGYSIRGRSSLNKVGVQTLLGTIDPDYCGPLFALLYNSGSSAYRVKWGERIAQIVFEPIHEVTMWEVKTFDLPPGARGEKGFGSSGR